MSGYYCRDCDAIKPLFDSARPANMVSDSRNPSRLEIPCLGTVPFDPDLARDCDSGIPVADFHATPVGRAIEHVAQQLLDSLESTTSASAPGSQEERRDREHPR
jgi:MinD-like ATPase involved in chromosome partitioning or flagellar assembly